MKKIIAFWLAALMLTIVLLPTALAVDEAAALGRLTRGEVHVGRR